MDLSALLLSQNVAMMPGNGELNSPEMQGEGGEGFGNLLNLVESMETAEMSEASSEQLAQMLKNVSDPEVENLNSQKLMAQAQLSDQQMLMGARLPEGMTPEMMINQENVGRNANQHSEMLPENGVLNPKATMTQKMPTDAADLLAMEQNASLVMKTKQQGQSQKLNLESVSAWSQALASREIKHVSVESTKDPVILQKQVSLDQLVNKAKMPGEPTRAPVAENVATLPFAKELGLEKQNVAELSKVASELDSKQGVEAVVKSQVKSVGSEKAPVDFEAFSKAVDKAETKVNEESSKKPVSAKDFMLAQMSSTKVETSQNNVAGAKSVEVSAEVVDFVADKVEQLKSSGSETLRVKMDSKDLGGLNIKVTLRRGLVDVDIRADRPESQSLLDVSKSQLQDKLAKVVELGDLDIGVNFKAINHAKVANESAMASMSHDVIRSMSKAEGADSRVFAQNLSQVNEDHSKMTDVGASQESQQSGTSQEFAREEKREQAMTQWQQFVNQKQSA